jgi:hypothetical protein
MPVGYTLVRRIQMLAGANRTVTAHVLPGLSLVARQVSLVMVNAAEPDSLTLSMRGHGCWAGWRWPGPGS